jgi:hypothetical protein
LKSGASKRKYYIVLILIIGFMFIYFTDTGFKQTVDGMFGGILDSAKGIVTGLVSTVTSSGPWQTYIEPRRDLALLVGGAILGVIGLRYGQRIITGTRTATTTVRESASKLRNIGGQTTREIDTLKTEVGSIKDIMTRLEQQLAKTPVPTNPGTPTPPPEETPK